MSNAEPQPLLDSILKLALNGMNEPSKFELMRVGLDRKGQYVMPP